MSEKILWSIQSRHAKVYCCESEQGGCYIKKVIAPNVVNEANAGWVNNVSEYFRSHLTRLNVPLAEPYSFSEENGDAIQISPYVGGDLEAIFKIGKVDNYLLEKIILSIKEVLLQENLEVGIDARLSNFCLGTNGSIYYVDTFPPLVLYKQDGERDELIVHFPNPTDEKVVKQEHFRKFHPLGILRRLRFSILEQNVGITENALLDAILKVMGAKFASEVRIYFEGLLDHLPIADAVEKISLDDLDGIRELALNCQPPVGERHEFLRNIFDLSSNFCPYELSDKMRLKLIKDALKGKKIKTQNLKRKNPH